MNDAEANATDLAARIDAALAEQAAKHAEVVKDFTSLIYALDLNLTPEVGEDGFITGYRMKTGYWHKIIGQ
jgi:hypothetical protein